VQSLSAFLPSGVFVLPSPSFFVFVFSFLRRRKGVNSIRKQNSVWLLYAAFWGGGDANCSDGR
jgi:hypothetical protein